MDKNKILIQAVEIVKSFGYKCFFPRYGSSFNEKPIYCYITDGTNIGYMQSNDWGYGLNFSSVHKPSQKNGTGFGILNDVTLENITKEIIEQTFGNPNWVYTESYGVGSKNSPIIKYKSWEDFVKNSLTGKISKDIIEL